MVVTGGTARRSRSVTFAECPAATSTLVARPHVHVRDRRTVGVEDDAGELAEREALGRDGRREGSRDHDRRRQPDEPMGDLHQGSSNQ